MTASLTIDTELDQPPVCVLYLSGELDYNTAPRLNQAIETARASGCRHLIADLTDLDFCSSSGITAFLAARKALHAQGGTLALAGLNARLDRIFRLTGLTRAFPIYPTAADARAAVPTT
ncbi:STAS domain-containing protein [Bailinhaonella thermotolerans]|uniref:Anti-sigma factor antagonist n=1 Tax=Bailinhaonella thermotolerans TaxID=1070861 RepID=A0A3A4AYU7_9ACTN|nr:STAS domain-containing protein [Bailinhaonella thermotolerans]RJL30420.1 anti-sigma factor antagonist [Bailinhaonella thermotolerans]